MFVEKVRDIVGLYLYPPQKAIALCDEKSQTQALERTQPILPMKPGYPERQSHDYYRQGVVSLFSAYEVATGRIIGKCHSPHREAEFSEFMQLIETRFPGLAPIHLVPIEVCLLTIRIKPDTPILRAGLFGHVVHAPEVA